MLFRSLCNTLAGLGFMSMTVTGLAIVQTTTPNRLLGRVTGLLLLGGGLMQVTGLGVGLLAGAIGIRRRTEHDRVPLNPLHLIAAAVIFVVLFIFTLLTIIRIVLS